jgi:hypothetical protein
MRRDDAKWLAALVDGEGTIGIGPLRSPKRFGYYIHVDICNTCEPLMREVLRVAGGGSLTVRRPRGPYKAMWFWRAGPTLTERLLRRITPFLFVKREQALLALEYQRKARNRSRRRVTEQEWAQRAHFHGRMVHLNRPVVVGTSVVPNAS